VVESESMANDTKKVSPFSLWTQIAARASKRSMIRLDSAADGWVEMQDPMSLRRDSFEMCDTSLYPESNAR